MKIDNLQARYCVWSTEVGDKNSLKAALHALRMYFMEHPESIKVSSVRYTPHGHLSQFPEPSERTDIVEIHIWHTTSKLMADALLRDAQADADVFYSLDKYKIAPMVSFDTCWPPTLKDLSMVTTTKAAA